MMFVEVPLQIGIAIVRGGAERVAKLGIRVGHEHRKEILAVKVNEQRPVVGNELGEQRDDKQR
jgi:hypothetical protein